MAKRIFIAATQQNDGKTTVSLGLMYCLKKTFPRIGFIKPVGQRYLLEQGYKVDEDSVLIEHVCHTTAMLKDMSPIAVERGFTEKYIRRPRKQTLIRRIKGAFAHVAQDKDLVIIEGTGHAGVGGVFDLSNAVVARLLESSVVVISSGGVGRPVDEVLLNKALFDKEGVEISGVIINKVLPEKYDKVNTLVRRALKRYGLPVLGVIPYEPQLSKPRVRQIQEELKANFLYGATYADNVVEKIVIGAMEPHDALRYIEDKSLVITPGDREDIIVTAISMHLIYGDNGPSVAGLVLTGDVSPHPSVLDLIKCTDIPVMTVKDDTYLVAARLHDLTVKIQPQDRDKTNLVIDLMNKYVDVKKIVKRL